MGVGVGVARMWATVVGRGDGVRSAAGAQCQWAGEVEEGRGG